MFVYMLLTNLCAELSVSVAVFVYVWGVACSSEGICKKM